MKREDFPEDFLWGTATAAYQIEGADLEDGKGPSIWTSFCQTPGAIATGEDAMIGCDHYHRMDEDLDLMKTLGINAYRFSISWPRVLPNGDGEKNQQGLDFYSRLVDGLLERKIQPMITLYHWDLPQSLQDRIKGWESRDIAGYFRDYAALMVRSLGDRVRYWITLNEPFCSSHLSYLIGEHAPGVKDARRSFQVAHHLLLAHGKAVEACRSENDAIEIGLTNVTTWVEPSSDSKDDQQAAFLYNQFVNEWFFKPPIDGEYPNELSRELETHGYMPEVGAADMETIKQPLSFWGVNYYTRALIKSDPQGIMGIVHDKPRLPTTDMGWEIYPEGLTKSLKMVSGYGNIPIYITENGSAEKDMVFRDRVHDEKRVKYLEEHFQAALDSVKAGVPLKGYFVWSFMDNFEWAYGFSKRFGLVFIDFEHYQRRYVKDSYHFFQAFLEKTGS